jgi:hypothetical protein
MWLSEQSGIVLDCVAFGRRVDDGENLLHMVEDETEVEDGILVGHAGHEGVLGERVLAAGVLVVGSPNLFVQSLDVGGEKAMEVECVTLTSCKC